MTTEAFYRLKSAAFAGDWARFSSDLAADPQASKEAAIDGTTLLILVAGKPGADSILQELLDAGADVNAISQLGVTPLESVLFGDSVLHSTKNQLRVLLQGGADPNQYMSTGLPVLHFCIWHGKFDFAALLLERGANPHKPSRDLKPASAYDFVEQSPCPDRMRSLLAHRH